MFKLKKYTWLLWQYKFVLHFRSSKRLKANLLSIKKLIQRSVSTMQSLKISEENKNKQKDVVGLFIIVQWSDKIADLLLKIFKIFMMGLVILWDDSFIFLVFVLWVSSCFNKQQAQPNWKVFLCMMKKKKKELSW